MYRNPLRFAHHLESLKKEIDRSNEAFIEHYKSKYTQPNGPPSWMSLEVSSLGLLSKIFQNLKKCPEKRDITSYFGLKDVTVLENWILSFSTLRNICAHHGRVWNRRLIQIKLPRNTSNIFLMNKSIYTNKLYATLSCIEYVLKQINSGSTMKDKLKELMKSCPLAQTKDMGFPKNWFEEELWK